MQRLLTLLMLLALAAPAFAQETKDPVDLPTPSLDGMQIENKLGIARKSVDQIRAGEVLSGTLSPSDTELDDNQYLDMWQYSGTAGERVRIELDSEAFDAYLMLIQVTDAGPVPVAEDDDSGDGLNARLDTELPATGQYVIGVTSAFAEGTGGYRIGVQAQSPNGGGDADLSGATELAAGRAVQGRLESSDPTLDDGSHMDTYTYQGSARERVTIRLSSSAFDTFLMLAYNGPNGLQELARDDDGGGGTNSMIQAELPYDGEYFVVANSYAAGQTGLYTMELSSGAAPAPSPMPVGQSDPSRVGQPGEQYAVLVGINDYPGSDSDLPSSVADAQLMRQTLINRFDFDPGNILMLLDSQATRENIIAGFQNHLSKAGGDGVAVFYYSGHGMQIGANEGLTQTYDPEPDGDDEALYIWGTGSSSILLDDEIGILADQLPTQRTLLVLDACHSGTGSRALEDDPMARDKQVQYPSVADVLEMPSEDEYVKRTTDDEYDETMAALVDAQRPHVLLSAADSDEVAIARPGGWPTRGGVASVFTYFLVETLDRASDTTTLADVQQAVQQQAVNWTQRNIGTPQTPQFYGDETVTLDQYLGRSGYLSQR